MENFKHTWGFPCGSASKESTCNVGDLGSVPGLGRSPGEGNTPGEFHGLYSPWGHRETRRSDFHFGFSLSPSPFNTAEIKA